MKSAIRDDDCVLFFEHKYLYRRIKGVMPEGDHTVPIGKGSVRRPGKDVTIVVKDLAATRLMFETNVFGPHLMARAVLPAMIGQRSGSIVNTSSVMAALTEPHHEAYTTSKAAAIGLTKSLAVTYAERGIRCNAICPGWVDTPMNLALAEQMGSLEALNAVVRQQQPLGRMVTVREVAHAVLFLASDDASGITGAVLHVDGAAGSAI